MACRLLILEIMVLANMANHARAELPSESQLPGEVAKAAQVAAQADVKEVVERRVIDLPSESQLPRETEPTIRSDVDVPPIADSPVVDLPDEGALPPETDGAAAAPEPAGALPLADSPDGIPWLRLNLRGHTAPIRAVEFMPDGKHFCTAGDDKSVVVWSQGVAGADEQKPNVWQYERTIRWQIQRGTRGRIYALASSPGLLAIGGEGAMGGTGEIVLVNPATGDFVTTLFDEAQGHRQVIVALNFIETKGGPALASQSMDGRTLLWTKNPQGLWKATVVVPDDRAAGVDAALAQRLLAGRVFSGIVAYDDHRVIVPVYDRTEQGRIVWKLEAIDASSGIREPLGGAKAPRLVDAVADMVIDQNQTKLVASDITGRVFIWDLKANSATRLNRTNKTSVASLELSDDGNTLVVGCVPDAASRTPAVEVWNLKNLRKPEMTESFPSTKAALAAALSPDASTAVCASGDSVVVRNLAWNVPQTVLRGAAEIPLRVAFSKEEPLYRIGIGIKRGENGTIAIDRTFDTDQLRLSRSDIPNEQRWLPIDAGNSGRRVIETTTKQIPLRTWSFAEGDARWAQLPLSEAITGVFRSVCWIPSEDSAKPTLAAIGTSAGGILIVELKPNGIAPIVRRFRGHTSDVTSLAISQDRRWLVSGSNDATVCVWPLGDVLAESSTVNRWGATFALDDDGRMMIESIREDGPLYFRGARQGDEVAACHWNEAGQNRDLTDPKELLAFLTATSWDQLVRFELRTGRQATRQFQILPAWQQMVSLVMDEGGEWAYWAPSGYYDASFEGHRLFGWQINRGLEELPDFFLAAQFRGVLERPAVMSRLLRTGTIEAAFRGAKVDSPADSAQTIANTYRLKPEVTILDPEGLRLNDGAASKLRAQIRVPTGQELVRVKAFANGVVAPESKLVEKKPSGTSDVLVYEWQLAIPSDPRVLVQVTAATDNEIAATDQLVLDNSPSKDKRKPRMFLLAAGIDAYQDAQIPKLRTPVAHVRTLTDLVRSQSSELYEVEASSMLDDRATKPAWNFLTKHNADRLREEASPDDLLVIYLSGHGVQDISGDQFQFVTANADYSDVMSGSYADCLSSEDFAQFVDIPCRKLVILDTCHGGAIQPLRHREMKMAVRALQQDVLITLAASDGAEEAVEGRFSTRLIEGLEGAADREDGNNDGVVRLDELVAYIKRSVGEDSIRDAAIQTPSAGPIDLLPFVTPPLSESKSEATDPRDSLSLVK